ncbi:MAG TPA: hypothetical protein V6D11_32215 [Waterburya sp.]
MTWISILALLVGGCQSGDNNQQATNSPSPAAIKRRNPGATAPTPKTSPFGQAMQPKQPGNSTAVAGLIPPVSPDDVVKRVAKGRSDPFTGVSVQPEVTVSPNPTAPGTPSNTPTNTRPVPSVPPLPTARPTASIPRTRTTPPRANTLPPRQKPTRLSVKPPTKPIGLPPVAANPTRPSAALPSAPPIATAPRAIPELPKLPEPTLAREIEVTGVVELSGVPMAIVKVPNEPSRYVREGQRLANGQVLVKRIEMNRGPNPVVVLEQYGIEVARGVGEAPAKSIAGGPTASLPAAPSAKNTNVPYQA